MKAPFNLLTFFAGLRARFFPQTVDDHVAGMTRSVDRLNALYASKTHEAAQHEFAAYMATTEADRAHRVSVKLSELLA